MISPAYDFPEFLRAVTDKDWLEIIAITERECNTVESRSYRVRGAPRQRQMGSVAYLKRLGEFSFFMRHGMKPDGVSELDFDIYKPICVTLVQKGQFKPSVLDLFNNAHN